MSSSKEYAKFKRTFIGPILPRPIAKRLQLGVFSGEMKAEKPKRHVSRKEKNRILHVILMIGDYLDTD